jgi:ribosomal protein S18 acetylase RimI-like enzyme
VTEDLAARAHRALIESFTDYTDRAGGRWEAREGVACFASPHAGGYANNAVVPMQDGLDPQVVLTVGKDFFGSLPGYRYELWVRAGIDDALGHAAPAAGMQAGEDLPTMATESRPDPLGEVRRLTEGDDLEHLLEVFDDAFAEEDQPDIPENLRATFARPERWLTDDLSIAIAYDGGSEPLAAGVVQMQSDTGYIPWVGTKAKARRRGLGAAITADLTRWVFERSGTACTLQSSAAGVGAYRAVGFREFGLTYHIYWDLSGA